MPIGIPPLRSGDVLFIRIANPLYARVAAACGSWESHVGLLLADGRGGWRVAESTVPWSRYTTLERFIARSENGRFAVLRMRMPLSTDQLNALARAAARRMGRLYHLGFKLRSARQFCSKFVHECYEEATGIALGRAQTFRELIANKPGLSLRFWKWWFLGHIPWQRTTLTTTSLLHSPHLQCVFDSATLGAPSTHHGQEREQDQGNGGVR